jgi:hypothetical protein
MKKSLMLAVAVTLLTANAFATYIVVLKNGTQYKAKAKWAVSGGKATFTTETGQIIQIDPSLIDEPKSEQTTKLGLGNAQIIDLDPNLPNAPKAQQAPSLGAQIKLRPLAGAAPAAPRPTPGTGVTPPPVAGGPGALGQDVIDKFERAYENVGIFEHKLTATDAHSLHVELTADNEDKVFNALSATSFLMVRNAGVAGTQLDMVELFLRTTTFGSAGRFQMTRADAEAIDKKSMTIQDYFVRKVIY